MYQWLRRFAKSAWKVPKKSCDFLGTEGVQDTGTGYRYRIRVQDTGTGYGYRICAQDMGTGNGIWNRAGRVMKKGDRQKGKMLRILLNEKRFFGLFLE